MGKKELETLLTAGFGLGLEDKAAIVDDMELIEGGEGANDPGRWNRAMSANRR